MTPIERGTGRCDRLRFRIRPSTWPMMGMAATLAVSFATSAVAQTAVTPVVVTLSPAPGATGVVPSTNVKIDFSWSLDTSTLAGLRILAPGGVVVPSLVDTDASLGSADIKPLVPLAPNSVYTIDVTAETRGNNGVAVKPFTASFTTGSNPGGGSGIEYRFTSTSLGDRPSVTSVAYGPDGHLYASDGIDSIWRYPLDPGTGNVAGAPERIYQQANMQTVGIAFSPQATAENLVLYTSHADRANEGNLYTGTVSKLNIPALGSEGSVVRTDVITGLPHPTALNHQPNGITFGPDGKLYQTVGGMATLGGSPNWGASETLLSAAVLVADVEGDAAFASTVNVNTSTGYNPFAPDAPVKIFATGLRNAYDLAWHSNGQLYSGINANSLNGATTPDDPGQPGNQAIQAKKHEMLAMVREGLYYGHPNSTRGEYILNGGNPTNGSDGVWEVGEYSVGVAPEPNFAGLPGTLAADGTSSGSSGIIFNTRASGGNSPNGLAEYTGPGDLNGKLLMAYFSGARTIQTFEMDPATGLVTNTRPLENPDGQPITMTGPLDVTVDPESGRIYVADFGLQADFGVQGRVMMLEPIDPGGMGGSPPSAVLANTPHPANPLVRAFNAGGSSDDVGINHYVWDFGDGTSGTGVAPNHIYPRNGSYVARLTVVDNDGLATSTSAEITIGTTRKALFVVNNTTLPEGDAAVLSRLSSLGFDVTVVPANPSAGSQANGMDVVVVSSTVNSGQVGNKFNNSSAGVVTWESFLFDDMLMTGGNAETSFGLTTALQSYLEVDPGSPLAAGLSGDVLFSANQRVFWGVPGPAADIVATLDGDPSKAAFFAYEAGDALFDGSIAPGNRVGLFMFDTTPARLTGDGWRLFDSAILFASSAVDALRGDFNGDGVVDAADYTVWRDGLGEFFDASHFDVWKSNFGSTIGGSGAGNESPSVPEPGSLPATLLLAGSLALLSRPVAPHASRKRSTAVVADRGIGAFVRR